MNKKMCEKEHERVSSWGLTYLSRPLTKYTHIRVSCQVAGMNAAEIVYATRCHTMPLIMSPSLPCQKRQNGSEAIWEKVSKQLSSFVCYCCQSVEAWILNDTNAKAEPEH